MQNNDTIIAGQAALVAALPALLGYVPTTPSIILVLLEGRQIHSVVRIEQSSMDLLTVGETIENIAEDDDAYITEVRVVIVGGDPLIRRETGKHAEHIVKLAGLRVKETLFTAAIEPGAMCENLHTGDVEALGDPHTTDTALARTIAGRTIAASREHIVESLRPMQNPKRHPYIRTTNRAEIADAAGGLIKMIAEGFHDNVTDQLVAALLTHGEIREVTLALMHTSMKDRAHDFIVEVARQTGSADAYAVAALYYLGNNGDGLRASITADYALQAQPSHTLGRLVAEAIGRGLPPHIALEVARSGLGIANKLGVELPA